MNDSLTVNERTSVSDSSRRAFLTRAGAFGLAPLALGILGGRGIGGWAMAANPVPLVHCLDRYVAWVGSSFAIAAEAGARGLTLTLIKAEPLKYHQPGVAEQFSLSFALDAGQPLESRIYHLVHPQLGKLELFISPVGSQKSVAETQIGEAIINCVQVPTLV